MSVMSALTPTLKNPVGGGIRMLIHGVKSRNSFPTLYLVIFTFFVLTALALFVLNPFGSGSDGTGAAGSYAVYRSQHNHFLISYPVNWQVSGGNEEAGVTTIASNVAPTTQEGGFFRTSLQLAFQSGCQFRIHTFTLTGMKTIFRLL